MPHVENRRSGLQFFPIAYKSFRYLNEKVLFLIHIRCTIFRCDSISSLNSCKYVVVRDRCLKLTKFETKNTLILKSLENLNAGLVSDLFDNDTDEINHDIEYLETKNSDDHKKPEKKLKT